MRGNKRDQLMHEERKVLEQKRSTESKARKQTRKEKRKAEETAKALQCSPAGKKAAGALRAKRGRTIEQEQANYQKTSARATARLEGRRKQVHAEFAAKVEE